MVQYVIDAKSSKFTVRAFATGLLSAFGHDPTIAIPDFEGEVHLTPEAMEQSSMRLVIHAASLTDTDDIREKDRAEINRTMHQEVLESDFYPEIVYESSSLSASRTGEGQYWGTMNGELTLHGVRRSQPIPTRIAIRGDEIKARREFSVRLSEYEMRPASAAGGTPSSKTNSSFRLIFPLASRRDDGERGFRGGRKGEGS